MKKDATSYTPQPTGPLTWSSSRKALGKVSGVALSGDFLLELEFDEAELRNWLERFVEDKPQHALPLLSEMHAKAILALHRQPHTADGESE